MSGVKRTALVMAMAVQALATVKNADMRHQGDVKVVVNEDGKGVGTGFGIVTPGASLGWYEEDHEAWGDLPKSHFVNVPNWLVGVTAVVPSHRLEAESLVEFHCPKKSTVKTHELEACDAFVFLYRCPPCVVERAHLEQQLVADGWTASGCGMDFKTSASGYPHRMMVLRKQFPADSTVSFTTPNKVIDFAAFGASSDGTDCGARTTIEDCNAAAAAKDGACAWDRLAEVCTHTNFCRRLAGPHGNGTPKCQVCPLQELAASSPAVHPPAPMTR